MCSGIFGEHGGTSRKIRLPLSTSWGGQLRFHADSTTYFAPTLYAYLYADLMTSPKERAKVCKRKGCEHPYFVARHLNQEFCSDLCAEEAKRAWNKDWWQKHGRSWRVKRGKNTAENMK